MKITNESRTVIGVVCTSSSSFGQVLDKAKWLTIFKSHLCPLYADDL